MDNNENESEIKDYKARIERLRVIAKDLLKREKDHDGISNALSGMSPEDAYIIGMIIAYMAKPLEPKDAMEIASKMSTKDAYFMGTSIGTFVHIAKGDIAIRLPAIKPPLGEIIRLHQAYEGENVCLYCGKPVKEWIPTEECQARY